MTETTTHGAYGGAQSPQPSRQPYTGADDERGRSMTRTPAEIAAASGVRSREPLARADRIQIALLAGLFALMAAMLGAGALGYTALSGQLLAIQQNMHEEIAGLRTEMHGETAGLRTEMREEIAGLRTEMRDGFRELRAEMQHLSERVARIETLIEIHHGPLPGP